MILILIVFIYLEYEQFFRIVFEKMQIDSGSFEEKVLKSAKLGEYGDSFNLNN
jgi:hypothetical protein